MVDGNDVSLKRAQWGFPLALTLHNLEEGIWLPVFWRTHNLNLPVSSLEFRIALLLVALLGYGITYWSVRGGAKSIGMYAVVVFYAIMLLNALWHIAATIYLRTYAPGVATAVVFILPVTVYSLRQAVRLKYI